MKRTSLPVNSGTSFSLEAPGFWIWLGALAAGDPIRSAIDGFAVHFQPLAHSPQDVFGLFGKGSVWLWANIQEQMAILAHVVHQVMNQSGGGLLSGVLEIPPTLPIIYGGIGDPFEIRKLVHPTQLQIHHPCTGNQAIVLVGNKYFLPALGSLINRDLIHM